jgi:serine/threonine protein kinase
MNVCPECGQIFPEPGFCTQDGTPLVSGDDPLLGAMLGPYRIAHLVGVGGMGRVYKGVNPTIRSRVAIKVLSHDCADRPELVERFFAEARAVNLIRHESIVNVLDLARLIDGRPYIVMEYLDGAPLSHLLAQHGRIPLGTLARIMAEVLAGLGAAHAKGVIHRDIKPDNIFVTRHGRTKILDFGVAKLASEQREGLSPTRAGSLLGTPHYMSPEQAQSLPVDARADLYAVGVILYEASTGCRPLEGDSVFEILRKQVEEEPVPPRRFAPDVPPAYERLILRAMAKDPGARWQSSDGLARALMEATAGLPPSAWEQVGQRTRPDSAGPPTPAPTTPRVSYTPPRRSRAPLVVAAGLVLVGVSIAAAVMVGQRGDEPSETARMEPAVTAGEASPPRPTEPQPPPRDAGTVAQSSAAGPWLSPTTADGGAASSAADDVRPARTTPKKPVSRRSRAQQAARASGEPDDPAGEPRETDVSPEERDPGLDAAPLQQKPMNAWDVSGYLPKALAAARRKFPDAVLARIDADGVYPNGRADLTLDTRFSVLYRFVSPAQAKRPPDLPQGVEHKPTCMYYVLVNHENVSTYPLRGWSCDDHPPIRMPRCSAREIWKRAAAQGAPTKNAVAALSYRASAGSDPQWWFDIGGAHQHRFDDDC